MNDMCSKHELEYGRCADAMFFKNDEDILTFIEDMMHAKIDRVEGIAEYGLKDLLDTWHEKGIMKPIDE